MFLHIKWCQCKLTTCLWDWTTSKIQHVSQYPDMWHDSQPSAVCATPDWCKSGNFITSCNAIHCWRCLTPHCCQTQQWLMHCTIPSSAHLTVQAPGCIKFYSPYTVWPMSHWMLSKAQSADYKQWDVDGCLNAATSVNVQSFLCCCVDFLISWHRLWWWLLMAKFSDPRVSRPQTLMAKNCPKLWCPCQQ